MKMKKVIKMLSVILVVMIAISTVSTFVMATTPAGLENVKGDTMTNGVNRIGKVGNNIVSILQAVGVVLSVVILIVIGIKYMMGSAEEKAEYKKTLMPYVIGAALIFAASMFAQVVYDFFNGWTV